MLIIVTPD